MEAINAECLKATIAGVEYQWSGGFGAVLISNERGVKRGEVRMIGDVIFYASGVRMREVWWIPQGRFDADWIREFKAAVFK